MRNNIEERRKQVDSIDDQILELLRQRAETCKIIGALKKVQGMRIRDNLREDKVYDRVRTKALEFGLNPTQLEAVYREIVNMCSAVQE